MVFDLCVCCMSIAKMSGRAERGKGEIRQTRGDIQHY